MLSEVRDSGSPPSQLMGTVLMRVLVGVFQAASKHIHPAALQEMVRSVGVTLGREAVAEYRLARQVTGRFDSYACARCLEAVGKQFGWELQASVESESIIRIDEHECPTAKLAEPNPYMTEIGYGVLGGVAADEFGYAKVCVVGRQEKPPFRRTFTIYLQQSEESLAAPGIVFPQTAGEVSRLSEWQSRESQPERLTLRETEVLHRIAQGLSDKEIAAALHLSVRTVQNHAAQIRHKLGIGSRTALVRFALRAPVRNV